MTTPGSPPDRDCDVVVAGAGPAGLALAAELAVHGLSVLLVDPHPDRPWRATHCGWLDELVRAPGFDAVASVRATLPRALVRDRHGVATDLGRTYVVLDPAGAPAVLRDRASAAPGTVTEVAGRVAVRPVAADGTAADGRAGHDGAVGDGDPGHRLEVEVAGRIRSTRLVVDAAGAGSTLADDGRRPASAARRWQWASGRIGVLDPAPVEAGQALVMDWSGGLARPGEPPGVPRSFGYALALGDGRCLVEETVLAGPRVAGVLPALSARLDERLLRLGAHPAGTATIEHVAIPLDCGIRRAHGGVLPVGVAAGAVHPASGYSVTGALRTAPAVAAAIARTLAGGGSPARAAAAGSAALWTPRRRLAHRLLLRGLRTTGALAPDELADFFAAFFALGPRGWAPYLAQPADPVGVATVMTRLFTGLPGPDRARLAGRWLTAGAPGGPRTRRVS